jgi:hypothetical protein
MNTPDLLHHLYLRVGDLAVVFLFVNVTLCFYHYKKLNLTFRLFSYFLLWNLLIEIAARLVSYSTIVESNLPLLHLYTLGEFLLLSVFYKSLMVKLEGAPQRINYFILAGAILIVLNSVFLQSIYSFNTIAKTAVQLTIISYAVLYFYNLTSNPSLSEQAGKSVRLINSAILVYYSGSLFIFMCSQVSFLESDLYMFFWAFNAALYLTFQLLVLWGIWKMVFQETTLSS